MASQRQPWATSDDYTAFSLLVIVIGLAFGLILLWYFQHQWIAWGFAVAAHYQITAYQQFTNRFDALDAMLARADYSTVTPGQIWKVMTTLGSEIRWPAAAIILTLAIPCYLLAAPSRYTRKFDLSGLIREQAASFPLIRVIAARELRLVRPAEAPRPLDPALTVAEWMERYGSVNGAMSEASIRAELSRQLGPLWNGTEHAAPIVRVLYVAFAQHLLGRRKEAQGLLAALSSAMAEQGDSGEAGPAAPLDVPGALVAEADATLKANPDLASASLIASRHAFTTTALMGLLNEARRKSGVLPPAAFLACKLVDRRLWYALHSLGFPGDGPGQNVHPNPRIEAAGSRAHWQAECTARRPLYLVQVDAAMDGTRVILREAAARKRKE